uniref:Uncharacterized protein n=1 Tax=Sphaerodactylus townsendi TaxID=933632 RepID=A0ACB8FYA9_9SAUR
MCHLVLSGTLSEEVSPSVHVKSCSSLVVSLCICFSFAVLVLLLPIPYLLGSLGCWGNIPSKRTVILLAKEISCKSAILTKEEADIIRASIQRMEHLSISFDCLGHSLQQL